MNALAADAEFPLALRVAAVQTLSPCVREIAFEPPPALAWTPGAHLRLRLPLPDGRQVLRRYSLLGRPQPGQPWRIAVKRLPDGRGGSAFMHALAPGDTLAAQAPANHFELPAGRRATWIVAGGIGVTPLLGHALSLAALPDVALLADPSPLDTWLGVAAHG